MILNLYKKRNLRANNLKSSPSQGRPYEAYEAKYQGIKTRKSKEYLRDTNYYTRLYLNEE